MPDIIDENITPAEVTPPVEVPPAPPAPPAAPPAPAAPTSKVVTMPSRSLAEIRKAEREKGKKAVHLELDAQAKKLGYASHAAMLDAVAAAKKGGGLAPTPKPGAPAARPVRVAAAPAAADKNRARHEEELAKSRRAAALADKKYRRERRERERAQAEISLREAAIRSGIDDTEYALHLLRKQYEGKTAEELSSFDERAFFTGLRDTHPQLFSVERVPATTGNAPKDPKAPAPAAPPVSEEPRDASKMSREQYQERLDKLGIRNPALGYSH